ncbi:GntR family transcriptional regulator [Halalkalibacillus halophilus]|uniref:GntR family transcriptional regulator n=1 Tax=Halalkalibacillus halophilus TaxID=392827 RepID=UPI0004239E7B|nr:GntR family transcriptional regulator [Halalkalibacillus halophilus]
MRPVLDESQPLFQQIAQMIADEIVSGELSEGDRIPSEHELSKFYNINRATVRKGLQMLVDEELVYKQRGIGMFVKEGAYMKLLKDRQHQFRENYLAPLLAEAKRLEISKNDLFNLIEGESEDD